MVFRPPICHVKLTVIDRRVTKYLQYNPHRGIARLYYRRQIRSWQWHLRYTLLRYVHLLYAHSRQDQTTGRRKMIQLPLRTKNSDAKRYQAAILFSLGICICDMCICDSIIPVDAVRFSYCKFRHGGRTGRPYSTKHMSPHLYGLCRP
jgi:hypothetical protein